ncbi:MAG: hypothetical protein ABR564_08705 [Candidatus Dormibacteria bacterium]
MSSQNGTPQLDYLSWRDEILQVMYWMMGEGIASAPNAPQLESFLGGNAANVGATLTRMAAEGYIKEVAEGSYSLTDLGMGHGKRSFAEEFDELTHAGHGECGPDCIFCHGPDADPAGCPSKMGKHQHQHAPAG